MRASVSPNASPEVLRVLIAYGADVNAVCEDGKTALIHASELRAYDAEIFSALLQAGADHSKRDASGKTALDRATEGGASESVLKVLRTARNAEYPEMNYRRAMFEEYERGEKLRVAGEVAQVLDGMVILHTRRVQHLGFMEDMVGVRVKDRRPRALAGDLFIARGAYAGHRKMRNALGTEVLLPMIDAEEYESREQNIHDRLVENIFDVFNW